MLSFKHLCSIVSNLNRARTHRYVLNRGFVGVSAPINLRVQATLCNKRLYSTEDDRPKIPPTSEKIIPPEACHKPNLMSMGPHPEEPFQEEYDKLKKKNRRILYLGVVIFIVSVVAAYVNIPFEKKVPKAQVKNVTHTKRKDKRPIPKNPELSNDIPRKVPYLLIGGGTASFSAFRAIKSSDPQAQVLIVTDEPYLPYMRPPLSKEMWFNADQEKVEKLIFKQWNGTERSLLYEPEEFYTPIQELLEKENGGISVASGYKVVEIDPYCHKVKLDNGSEIEYDKALLATGARAKSIPVFDSAKNDPRVSRRVKEVRNIYDFEDLQECYRQSLRVAIIGGGFLGSELACALARIGCYDKKTVYQIFKESGNLGKMLPEYLSRWTTDKVTKEGVHVKPNAEVVSCSYNAKDKMIHLILNTGETLKVEQVVLCTGVAPNTALATKGGLEIDPELGGYLVNSELQARSDLYVAGDAACFYDPKFGRRRIEHHDHAVVTGRLAGENMTGAHKPYIHQSMFWSDLGPDIGFEAIGLVDSKLPTVGVFAKGKMSDTPKAHITETDSEAVRTRVEINQAPPSCDARIDAEERREIEVSAKTQRPDLPTTENPEDFGKGVVFYMRNDKIVGVLLWNVFNRIQTARQILKEDKTYDDLNEVAKLFNIHQD
ncbi:apoptosis-inducing factor 1, mitochondrial [Harmonia axyridis]|uniref:apoptosis-inducing factor 1, mitochondrial n=1 Tax=Harmonia axyridis TaxID=115357 RepID=UPI001E27743A|nr:apoptosis-inducing factor 1, mitochondrial [Harmonia axyridis]